MSGNVVLTRDQWDRLCRAYDGLVAEGIELAITADTDGIEEFANQIGEVLDEVAESNA